MSSVSGSGERILAILDLFTEDQPEWHPDALMAKLGYSRPTLYRYLKTLKDSGYLVSLPGAGFTLGPRVTELDFVMQRSDPLIDVGQSSLEEIASRFPGSAFLLRWYAGKLLCVASVISSENPRSSYPRGRAMPLGRGAISRAIVAFLAPGERRKLVKAYLPEFAVAGVGSTLEEVLSELKNVRRDGVAVARGEVTPGVVAVAAPVLVGDQNPIGAICLTSDESQVDEAALTAIRTMIREAAVDISQRLNHAPAPPERQPSRPTDRHLSQNTLSS